MAEPHGHKRSEAMFEEILEGSPIGKWQEIVFNANKSVVNDELERLLECLALYQEFVNLEGLEDKFAQFARLLGCDEELASQIKAHKNNLAIESMASILSKNE